MKPHTGLQRANRKPLHDFTAHVNNQADRPPAAKESTVDLTSLAALPHHESRFPNGSLVKNSSASKPKRVLENKHLNGLVNQAQHDPKRLSEVSAASTNASSASRSRKTHIGPWQLGPTLGKGATGRVRKARHAVTGQLAAVKIVSRRAAIELRSKSVISMEGKFAKKPLRPDRKRIPFGIDREIVIMKVIEHPNVIKVFDVWENRGEMYLVLDLVEGGELFEYVVNNIRLPEIEAMRIFRQILSALAHLHQFLICHRDIKPENIMLDQYRNVKLVDFGMAVLQQEGKMLDTSCGSPHYAAPEVAQGFTYNGRLADVWSAGIVLYVMLVGAVPFGCHFDVSDDRRGSDNLRDILSEVIYSEPCIPGYISRPAERLLRSMLQKNPARRIVVQEIWSHPLMLQYDEFARYQKDSHRWIGGPPAEFTEEDCGQRITDEADIDLDVVDNLSILWQMEDNAVIVENILQQERNFAQLLYHRILRSRVEQEENFQGLGVAISSSDYHHVHQRLPRRSATKASLLGAGHRAQRSQFSIIDNSRRPSVQSRGAVSETGTASSYDPYRPSKHRFTSPAAESKITIIQSPGDTGQDYCDNSDHFVINPAMLRLQKEGERFISNSPASSPPMDTNGNIRELRRQKLTRLHSRSSFASSARSKTSSLAYRRSVSYKRPVSFNHQRHSSVRKSPPLRPRGPSPLNMQQRYRNDRLSSTPDMQEDISYDLPNHATSPELRSRKEGLVIPHKVPIVRHVLRNSAYVKEEARQVSIELEKYCDSAFNGEALRKPAGSNDHEIAFPPGSSKALQRCDKPQTHDSKPKKHQVQKLNTESLKHRPLPNLPPIEESRAAKELKELQKTRQDVLKRKQHLPSGALDSVLGELDRLICQQEKDLPEHERRMRVISAPEAHAKVNEWLSPVKEESNIADREEKSRHASDPTHKNPSKPKFRGLSAGRPSIRVVDTTEYDPVPQPLTIRKKFSGMSIKTIPEYSLGNKLSTDTVPKSRISSDTLEKHLLGKAVSQTHKTGEPESSLYNDRDSRCLEAMSEDEAPLDQNLNPRNRDSKDSRESKRKGWFQRRSASSQKSSASDEKPVPPEKDTMCIKDTSSNTYTYLDPGQLTTATPILPPTYANPIYPPQVARDESDDFSFRPGKREHAIPVKNKFLKFFSRKEAKSKSSFDLCVVDDTDSASAAPSSLFSSNHNPTEPATTKSLTASANHASVKFVEPPIRREPLQPAQNWLARLLHVKPAKRVLVFRVTKVKAMKEVRNILKDWRPYGMHDITFDRVSGRICARVDQDNTLHIKPVSIAFEFFPVARKNNRPQYCVARASQEHGAKSSFIRVVETLIGVLRGREFLITDKRTAREMKTCFDEWESR